MASSCTHTYRIMASSCTQTFRIIACAQTFHVVCCADESLSLAVRNGEAVLATANARDECQHWIKDTSYSNTVTDEEDQPAFALVNIATGQALKHSIGRGRPVRLTLSNPDYLDESILWTTSKDDRIRMVNNIGLTFDARDASSPEHGGASDGTTVVLDKFKRGENQRWKFVVHETEPFKGQSRHPMRIFCRQNVNLNVTIRDNSVVLAHANPNDEFQHWIKDFSNIGKLTDEEGRKAFALVNKATGQAIKYSRTESNPVQLAPYEQDRVDVALLWTEGTDIREGFRNIRVISNLTQVLNGYRGDVHDGTIISLYIPDTGDNSIWKILPI